jgi:hypothetical protein
LPSKYEVLSSDLSTTQKKEKKGERMKEAGERKGGREKKKKEGGSYLEICVNPSEGMCETMLFSPHSYCKMIGPLSQGVLVPHNRTRVPEYSLPHFTPSAFFR